MEVRGGLARAPGEPFVVSCDQNETVPYSFNVDLFACRNAFAL
jgi:hypothetical protein